MTVTFSVFWLSQFRFHLGFPFSGWFFFLPITAICMTILRKQRSSNAKNFHNISNVFYHKYNNNSFSVVSKK